MPSAIIHDMKTADLKPHPANATIYGDETLPADFLESIKTLGVIEPLLVRTDGTIISGHRRWLAAKKAGLATVPTRTGDFADELEEIEMLISSNKQREKSPSQIAREGSELQRIERERNRLKQAAAAAATNSKLGRDANEETLSLNSNEASQSLADVAETLGISRDRWYKIRTIFEKAQHGDAEAVELMKALDAGDISVHKAYQTVKGQLDSEKGEKNRITKALEEAKKNLDEALQNPLTIEVEKEVFVTPPEVTERLRELETDLSIAKERAERLDQKIQEAKDVGKDYESLLQKKMDLHKSIDELLKKNDLAEQERKWALVVVNSAREIRETLNRHKGIIEEASRKGVPAWANANSIRECAERCYEIGDLLSKVVETVDIPTGEEGEYERCKLG